jgi:hypothetical protein
MVVVLMIAALLAPAISGCKKGSSAADSPGNTSRTVNPRTDVPSMPTQGPAGVNK